MTLTAYVVHDAGDLKVVVYGDRLPTSVFGAAAIACAIARNLWTALMMCVAWPTFDVVIVDQLSVGILLLRLRARRIVFYCHFPDMHLSRRTTWLKRLYRAPFDALERITMAMADHVLCNWTWPWPPCVPPSHRVPHDDACCCWRWGSSSSRCWRSCADR